MGRYNMLTIMQIVNLDSNFIPFGRGIDIESFDFPSGCEPHIRLKSNIQDRILITHRLKTPKDIIILMLTVDALRRENAKYIELFIPYVPFARQDRVMNSGEPLSLRVMANIINSMNLDKVAFFDPHS